MSTQRTLKEPVALESRRTVVVIQNLRDIGSQPFQVNLQQNQVDFVPTRMVIRQVAYANTIVPGSVPGVLGSDQGIFTIYSSVSRQPAAFVTVGPLGITATTEQVLNIPTYNPVIEFAVQVTDSSVTSVGFATVPLLQPTGLIALSIELF